MKNTNKLKKGTFEKINERLCKINGNEVPFTDEGNMDLIPIIKDIVERKENIAIENYNLSKLSYPIGGKEVPIAELITEITIFLDSLPIRQKVLKDETCYYEIGGKELSVEDELTLLVEDVMNGVYVNVADYKFKKKSYLINNTVVPVTELAPTIQAMCPFRLNDFKVGDHFYDMNGQITYIEDELVPIIENVFNYKDRVAGIEKEIYQFRFLIFALNLPDSIKQAFSKQQIKCNEFNIHKIEEVLSELQDDTKIEQYINLIKVLFKLTSINQVLDLLYQDCFSFIDKELINNEYNNKHIDSFVDWFIRQFDLKIKKWYKKNFNGSTVSYRKYVIDRLKANGVLAQQLDEHLSVLNSADPSPFVILLVAVVRHFKNEYRDWEENIFNAGEFSLDYITSLDCQWTKEAFFIYYHNYCQSNYLYIFFDMLNECSLTGAEYEYTIEKLKDIGLDEFVQKEYDKYRKITGAGKDFCFYEQLDIIKVGKELSRYYANLPNGEKDYFFTRMCLSDVIDNVIPALKSGLDVAAFALLLWKSKSFNSSIEDDRFTNFRDDIANIFKLDGIPNITNYTAGKSKVKEKAKSLRGQFKSLKILVEEKHFT